jgi:TolB-like protein
MLITLIHSRCGRNLLVLAVLLIACAGCAAVRSTPLKTLEPVQLDNNVSVTIAFVRDVSEESITTGLLDRKEHEINLSEPAELKLGSLFEDSGCFSKVRIVPHSEIPKDATELTCVSLARKEGTDLVIYGEVNHRASMTLNWLTLPSYIPGIAIAAPLWAPNYTLKGEVELTLHVMDVHDVERIISRKFSEEAYTTICFLTRVTALHDRYVELEKEVALHNAAVEAGRLILDTLTSYRPGASRVELKSQGKVIAVADFDAGSDFVKRMGYDSQAAELFTTAFESSGFFKVMERQRIKDVLAERAFTMTDLVKKTEAREVAKLHGVDYLLLGSIAKVGGRLQLNVRLLDVSNASILVPCSESISRDADLQILVELMARRVAERFSELKQPSDK